MWLQLGHLVFENLARDIRPEFIEDPAERAIRSHGESPLKGQSRAAIRRRVVEVGDSSSG